MKANSSIYQKFGLVGLASVALLSQVQAVVPPPDGGYPGGNTAEGTNALLSLTTGQNNTAVGVNSLSSISTGGWNTAIGAGALRFNIGVENTAVGFQALFNNTTGISNTANGYQALFSNTDGFTNTANGAFALANNRIADNNTATGYAALYRNTGMQNTANGAYALSGNTLGHDNTVTGYIALSRNTTGIDNTANGSSALGMNPTGDANTAVGFAALDLLTHGNSNTAIGANALDAISDGGQNIALGSFAGGLLNSGDYNIYIGSSGASFDNGTIRIGDPTFHSATYVAGIYGQTASPGIQVYINSDGQLGTVVSSERFKKDIAGMENASDAILSLRPVTFHYKTDSKGTPQFGLVAEEVAKVNPALVLPDKEGKPYTVRYDAVNAMLLNEFLKEHRRVEEQGATIAQLKQDFQSRLSAQQKQIERLTAGLQKVSAQLELSKTAPQTVLNRQ